MIVFLAHRLAIGAVTLLLITVVMFALINIAPGGPAAIMSMSTTADQRSALTAAYGLNQPVPVRYLAWLGSALHGSLGRSYDFQEPVVAVIGDRLPNTAILAGAALLLSVVIGIPLGIWAALARGSWIDTAISAVATLGLSLPDFWVGTVLIIIFAVLLHALPASGMTAAGGGGGGGLAPHLIMPATVLSLAFMPNLVRLTRSGMIEVLGKDYVRTARAKGLCRRRVTYKHAFRNAMVPVLSMIGLLAATLLGGSAIVESVFAWPGIGRLTVQAATNRDYPLIMGLTLLVSAIVIAINILVDFLYAVLDPRIRYD